MRSNNVLSAGSPSHFLRIMAFRKLSLGAFSSQSIMITLERSRFNEDKSWQSEIQNNYFIHSTVDYVGGVYQGSRKVVAPGKPKNLKPYDYELCYSHILDGDDQRFPSYGFGGLKSFQGF